MNEGSISLYDWYVSASSLEDFQGKLTISNIRARMQARKPGATIEMDALFLVNIPNIVCYSDRP